MKTPEISDFVIRFAEEKDAPAIFAMIKELATYEKLLDRMEATEELICQQLFHRKIAETLIAELQGKPVGYAIFFHNFSSFLARPGIYIEDIYIKPEVRGNGFGKALFSVIAEVAKKRECGGLEWACLDWNAPSIAFYKRMGAEALSDWTIFRLARKNLLNVSGDSC
jgi:GNAT superfamily N-acetyltransferase